MAVKAFPFEKLDSKIENVYEAVMIGARRARQINEDQILTIRNILGPEDNDSEDARPLDRDEYKNIEKLPKPVALSLNELVECRIEFEYLPNRE